MGEIASFDILFHRHSGRVLGFLSMRLKEKKEAQDLLQEVFFKLHRSRHQYNSTLPFMPWLFSITRSVLLDHLKRHRKEHFIDTHELEDIPSSDTAGIIENQAGIPAEALNILPVAQREAISLRVYDEKTFEEIALRLSTSPENARQLVSRGLKRLRERWKARKG